ncbi:MAG TPA: prepilin peptidase [Patescibacteria group bacterium]|nr:prepilin peptidase [Patescibacteria group bacterium]
MLSIQIIIFILGLSIGSFLNVCIYRIPEKKSIAYPASHCPRCKHNLSAVDLIPVLGYVVNRGKCKYCGTKISIQYPMVELITAVVFLFLFNKFFLSVEFVKYAVLASMLILITFVDLERQEIPDEVILFGLIIGLIFNVFDIKANMLPGIIGFVLGGGIFLLIAILTNGAMGGGDIKLMAVLGLFLGWKFILLISLISFVIGAVASLILIATKIKGTKDYIPFGPFIAIAAMSVIFYGTQIIQLYVQSL